MTIPKNPLRLRSWLQKKRYERMFPGVTVAMGATITGSTTIQANTQIGAHSVALDAAIGSRVVIAERCQVVRSQLADRVTLGYGCGAIESRIDDNVSFYSGSYISQGSVGRYSYLASNGIVNNTKIGSFCSVGPALVCGYGEHPTNFVSTSPVFFSTRLQCGSTFSDRDYFVESREISIGNDVWIGAGVFIRDGVSIGNGVIIGAGAVVVKNIPDYAVVGGVPATLIRMRYDDDTIARLLDIKWWEWNEDTLREAQPLFAQNDIHRFFQTYEKFDSQ